MATHHDSIESRVFEDLMARKPLLRLLELLCTGLARSQP